MKDFTGTGILNNPPANSGFISEKRTKEIRAFLAGDEFKEYIKNTVNTVEVIIEVLSSAIIKAEEVGDNPKIQLFTEAVFRFVEHVSQHELDNIGYKHKILDLIGDQYKELIAASQTRTIIKESMEKWEWEEKDAS